jgi:chromosome partitioning protein
MTGGRRRPSLVSRVRAVGGIVLGVAKTKGGVAGSTLAHNLAYEFAQRGARVLVVDTDTQQTLIDSATHRLLPPRLTLVSWPHPTLWEDLPRLRAGQDVVLIDGQGHHHQITRSVIAATVRDRHGVVLVPMMPGLAEVRAARRELAPILAEAAGLVPWQIRARTVLTRYVPREHDTAETLAELAAGPAWPPPPDPDEHQRQALPPLSRTGLERRRVYVQSLSSGQAVCELEPGGAAARETAELATECAELALPDPKPREASR